MKGRVRLQARRAVLVSARIAGRPEGHASSPAEGGEDVQQVHHGRHVRDVAGIGSGGARRESRYQRRIEGHGRGQSEDDSVFRHRFGFRRGTGLQPELAVAEVHRQDLHADDRFRGAGLTRRSDPPAGRRSPARRRPAADSRRAAAEPDDHRQRRHAVGPAVGNLDDAIRVPACGHRQ